MLNSVTMMGRLVADPELRHTADGKLYAFARLACDRDSRDRNGERQADFVDIIAWNGSAEFLNRYFTKGRMICVKGRLQSREYKDKAGNNRNAVGIKIESIYFADSKREDTPKAGGAYYADALPMPEDDDIPPEWRE